MGGHAVMHSWFGISISNDLAYDIFAIAMTLLALIISLWVVSRLFKRIEKRMVEQDRDVYVLRYIRIAVKAIIYVICITAILRHVPGMSSLLTSLLAGSGILAVVIGLASQQALGNIISGMILLVFRPFQVGDTIRYPAENATGVVEQIGVRHTVVRTGEDRVLLIPNSLMNSNVVENITKEAQDD